MTLAPTWNARTVLRTCLQVCTRNQIATQRKRLRFGKEEQGSGRMTLFYVLA